MLKEKINELNSKKIVILGIGGGANFYIARFFNFLGAEVTGFDINKNERTEQLEKEGVKINYNNPDKPFDDKVDLIIYSKSLPQSILENILIRHPEEERSDDEGSREQTSFAPKPELREVGEITNHIISQYEKGKLNKNEIEAFNKSNLAPLFNLNLGNTKLIGITGTDGKTTTSSILYSILKQSGSKVGLVTTLGAKISTSSDSNEKEVETGLHTTTPSNQELYELLNEMINKGCKYIILETSSHGLAMGRVAGLKYDVAVITNISKEHLDYHKTFKEYLKAKSLLFSKYLKKFPLRHPEAQPKDLREQGGIAILNFDDKKSYDFLKNLTKNTIIYSLNKSEKFLKQNGAKIYANKIKHDKNESKFIITSVLPWYHGKTEEHEVTFAFPEQYNISNALAAVGAATAVNIEWNSIQEGMKNVKKPRGRMNLIQEKPFKVIVDFAHTPNALDNALKEAELLKQENSKLIVVFGCAGNRDTSKRLPMGTIAGKYADITILTAEDPRTESLKEINDEIEKGWIEVTKANLKNKKSKDGVTTLPGKKDKLLIRYDDDSIKEHIRRQAIARALREAHHNDVVIITGKGHENSLCFGTIEYDWNDIEETKKLLGVS